ncbi:MAG: hypothetical protein JW754_01105 [Candidatus Aenigmarchaeota archaeon]|nr:hypothetical protein [Candidatus Aenigmarchaeota archaeon]
MRLTERIKKEILFELFIFWTGITFACLLFWNNYIVLAFLFFLSGVTIYVQKKKYDILFYFTAVLVGSSAEIICVNFGAWSYTNPMFLGVPVWIALGWGLVLLLVKRMSETFVKMEKSDYKLIGRFPRFKKGFWTVLLVFFLSIMSLSFHWTNNTYVFMMLALLTVISLFFWNSGFDRLFFINGAVIGTLMEIVCIRFGIWAYANPMFLGITIWTPLMWGLWILMMKGICETIVKIEKIKI